CVMSLDDGVEHVILTSAERWDCPIWAPDGRAVYCSSKGKLWRMPLSGDPPQEVPAGTVAMSRGYAFTADGKRPGFTRNDAIFLVPAEGGEPAPILPKMQGYLHGWSPDGKTVLYCCGRNNGPLGCYSRSADGGDETRLLSYAGWSDSPEESPDGKWIYFV